MTIPVIIAVAAIAVIVALIIYIVLIGTAKCDPVEKAKDDAYFSLQCREQVNETPVRDLCEYTELIYFK